MRFPIMWYVGPAKRSLIRDFASLSVKLLTEHHLEVLGLKGGYTGSTESTFVKTPHCYNTTTF